MSRITRVCSILCFLMATVVRGYTLDLALSYHMANIDFASNRSSTDTTYSGGPITWGIDGSIGQRISSSTQASVEFTMDPVLHNVVYGKLSYDSPYFVVSGGPMFGLLNSSDTILSSGVRASIMARLPGIAFVALDSGSTFGTQLIRPGDYSENASEISAGFYVRNAICSFHLTQKGFNQKDSNGTVETTVREYSLQADTFQKNVPYHVLLKLGYELQSRYYDYASPVTQTLGSIIVGARVTARLNNLISLVAGLESNVYTFGLDSLYGQTVSKVFLFRASAGIELHPFSSSENSQ